MPEIENCNVLVIGRGEAGKYLAYANTVLRDAIFTHPTAAEGLTGLLAEVGTETKHESATSS